MGDVSSRTTGATLVQLRPIQWAAPARQSQGSTYTGTLNRVQQAFFFEHNRFARNLRELNAGFPSETDYFRYSSSGNRRRVVNLAQAKVPDLRSFKGIVELDSRGFPVSRLCITRAPGMSAESADRLANDINRPCGR
ncbi:MAG: hypothetical protein EA001_15165 [Oscillatoriales cyanobacterium]|nr:MAG: hypothetical protein EA001_15165 [Oscillatoriales cyanobacterium]